MSFEAVKEIAENLSRTNIAGLGTFKQFIEETYGESTHPDLSLNKIVNTITTECSRISSDVFENQNFIETFYYANKPRIIKTFMDKQLFTAEDKAYIKKILGEGDVGDKELDAYMIKLLHARRASIEMNIKACFGIGLKLCNEPKYKNVESLF